MNYKLLISIFVALLLSSCLAHRMGMYLSPVNSITNTYHTIPLKSDSLKSAVYASLLFSTGSANDKGWDWIRAGQASIYRSHNLDKCQAYYGANISLGNYYLTDFYNSHYTTGQPSLWGPGDNPIDTFYHIPGNSYFFGSYGLSAGINGVKSSGR